MSEKETEVWSVSDLTKLEYLSIVERELDAGDVDKALRGIIAFKRAEIRHQASEVAHSERLMSALVRNEVSKQLGPMKEHMQTCGSEGQANLVRKGWEQGVDLRQEFNELRFSVLGPEEQS